MLEKLIKYLENKKILILGYGLEGKSTYRFLRNEFPEKSLFIADRNEMLLNNNVDLIEDPFLEISLGENYLNGINEFDLIIKAPGISLKDIDITPFENKITSELELFLEFVNIYTIGITGTKGKSTTSSLIYKILKDQGKDAYLLGNIGEPIFEKINEMTEESLAVIELSSHALEYVHHSTNIALILDVFEEHLDHYKSLEKYIEAKFNVAKYQSKDDILIYNFDSVLMNEYGFKYKEEDFAVSIEKYPNVKNALYIDDDYIYYNQDKLMDIHEKINLKGIHNLNNIMFVLGVSIILKLDNEKTINSIKEFKPLEHRMEFVAKINDVSFYNDSIATIPEATIDAIKAIKDVNTLLVGGNDRGVNLQSLINFLKESNIENIICLPKTGEYIRDGLNGSNKNIYFEEELESAVKLAKKITKPGMVCLLSPAASSYGYFKNFEERGKLFKEFVLNND